MTTPHTDPITLEVMRNAFYSIADEMIAALIRSSYSTNIKDRRDTSGAIYTGSGEVVVVAQSEIGTPLHLGTMHSAVQSAMAAYPFEELEPGDAVALNTPYPAGPGHLNDLCLISPLFYEGRMIAITANQAHHVDMGGFARARCRSESPRSSRKASRFRPSGCSAAAYWIAICGLSSRRTLGPRSRSEET